MKKLDRKIGVGVLVAGLVLGGAAFSGRQVVHADKVEGQQVEVEKQEEDIEKIADDYGFGIIGRVKLKEVEGLELGAQQFNNLDQVEYLLKVKADEVEENGGRVFVKVIFGDEYFLLASLK